MIKHCISLFFGVIFLVCCMYGSAMAEPYPAPKSNSSQSNVTVWYDSQIRGDIKGLNTFEVTFPDGLSMKRVYAGVNSGKPLIQSQRPIFRFIGAVNNNQLVSGPVWNPGQSINDPQEYVLISIPVKEAVKGGKLILDAVLRAWNPVWTQKGATYVFRFCYALENQPDKWVNVENGGLVPVTKSGNVPANNLPVHAVIPLEDEAIAAGGVLYLRLSMYSSDVVNGNVSFVDRIKISYEK